MSSYAPRTDFGPPPPGYVPGVGRGATGFMTGSRPPPTTSQAPGFGTQGAKPKLSAEELDAQQQFAAIDERMANRRKRARDGASSRNSARDKRLRVDMQLEPLKAELKRLTEEDWRSIPESKDYSRQNKLLETRNRANRKFYAVPDHILLPTAFTQNTQNASAPGSSTSTAVSGATTSISGISSTMVGGTYSLGQSRKHLLSMNLDRVSDAVDAKNSGTKTNVSGYLTELDQTSTLIGGGDGNALANISDIKKARDLLKSVISTNKRHAPGWIAAARLERDSGKLEVARRLLLKGTQYCPYSEDLWEEAASLHPPNKAKQVYARAIAKIPTSVKIWTAAANLETDKGKKRRVFRRALQFVPRSVGLWKAAVALEDPDNARILLARAVELVPDCVDFWLALAKLETYDRAKVVLNKARRALPGELKVWVAAAQLEETHVQSQATGTSDAPSGTANRCKLIIKKAVKSLQKRGVVCDREQWLAQARACEASGCLRTCRAIISQTLGMGVEEVDRRTVFLRDAEACVKASAVHSARYIYAVFLDLFPTHEDAWLDASRLEKAHATHTQYISMLERAVQMCSHSETLWLTLAREKWQRGELKQARAVLDSAFRGNSQSEAIWLAAAKLELDAGEPQRARSLLERATERQGSARLWMKRGKLERMLGDTAAERKVLDAGLEVHPKDGKLWLMRTQNLVRSGTGWDAVNKLYRLATRAAGHCGALWVGYAGCCVRNNKVEKARAVLEAGRSVNPRDPRLWLASIRLEHEVVRSTARTDFLMATALKPKHCPSSALLWVYKAVALTMVKQRQAAVQLAMEACQGNGWVVAIGARLLWSRNKLSKARAWFERAVRAEGSYGDVWAYYLCFETQRAQAKGLPVSSEANLREYPPIARLLDMCEEASPCYGVLWTSLSKKWDAVDQSTAQICIKASKMLSGAMDLGFGDVLL